MDIVTSAAPKGLFNGLHITRIDDFHWLLINTLFVQRITEHGHGLKEVIDQYFLANQSGPMELIVRFATGDKEAVAFIDLGEKGTRFISLKAPKEVRRPFRVGSGRGRCRST